jgi:ribosomal protein S18 acetylase RimI-like enzyme
MNDFIVAEARLADCPKILALYRTVAAIEGGLARTADEISESYVENFVARSIAGGIILIARESSGKEIIGEIHGYALGPKVFGHVLGELTIAVHPRFQSAGIGRAIFSEFMRRVVEERPDILRVELIARESNERALNFYQKLGFEIEGRMANRIRSVNGGFEADIPMAWLRK